MNGAQRKEVFLAFNYETLDKMEKDDMIKFLKTMREIGGIAVKAIAEHFMFASTMDYYMYLRRKKIYNDVVKRSEPNFSPAIKDISAARYETAASSAITTKHVVRRDLPVLAPVNERQLSYELNLKLTGPALADRLTRLAALLGNSNDEYELVLSVKGKDI
jgi:hypothetical protein